MKLTTSFKLIPNDNPLRDGIETWLHGPTFASEVHQGMPLVRTHERAAAVAFHRNPDATHCIVSTKGERDAQTFVRASKTADEWQAIRERKGT